MMAEALQLNPFLIKYYNAILDKYYDPNGDLQCLATTMTISLKERIEKVLQ